MAGARVTDPELLRLLDAPEAPAGGPQRVTDPDLIRQLEGADAAKDAGPSVVADVAKAIPSGLARGVAGVVGLPHAAMNFVDEWGLKPIAKALVRASGRTPTSDLLGGDPRGTIADAFPGQEQVLRPVEAVTGELPKPKTFPGEVVNTLAEFAPNALLGGGSVAQRVGQVVVPALASEGLGQAARRIMPAAEPAARAVGALGGAVGAAVAQAPKASSVLMRQALDGIAPDDLAAAQALREQAKALPGGGVDLTLDEALNHVTGGRATRLSQLSRVVANSGGEGARVLNETYAARPGQVDRVGRAALDPIAPESAAPSGVGLDVQAAARAGVGQSPEGMALTTARTAVGPRTSADPAGRVIQPQMRGVMDAREATRAEQANRDYAAARAAPENVGVERMITVERPGEPVVTHAQYGRPQFNDGAPRPLDPPPTVEAEAAAGPMSLGRFIARNGGLPLEGDVLATDLHRFNIPGMGNVARSGGKSIDNFWRERLMEEGYFRPDADGGMARDISSELLRKLQNEQRGFPSFPIGQERVAQAGRIKPGQVQDDYRAALSEAESRLDKDLVREGVDPGTVHPDIRERVLGALMRGEESDPLTAYERTVNAMRENPAPFVKSTTVQEQIPDVQFGQVDPRPAVEAVSDQARTAKGDIRGALAGYGRDLRTPSGELDMTVEGLRNARGRLDADIRAAAAVGDREKAAILQGQRATLDEQLKAVPELAHADANFAANSRPLEPFQGNAPLAQITRREGNMPSGRFMTPAEQVPSTLSGPTAAREFLGNATPEARQAFEGHVATRMLDGATDRHGNVDAAKLAEALCENADVLEQMPAVYHRLDDVVRARDGLARVEASPLGQLAENGDVGRAINVLFPRAPTGAGHQEIASAMGAVARNNPGAARDLARIHLETALNAGTRDLRGMPAQYGGASFASGVRGNPQQARNLEASIRALPQGDTIWRGLDRMLDTLEATGWRPQKGSDTAFNIDLRKQMAETKGPLAAAISDAATHAAVGGLAGGAGGAGGAALFGLKNAAKEAHLRHRIEVNGEQLARMLTDPAALPDLRALLRSREGTPNAQLFATRLLTLAHSGAKSGHRQD